MASTILHRWKAFKHGDGLQRARRISRYLSLAVLALCFPVTYGCVYGGLPSWFLVAISVLIGWLLAERNALDARINLWPTLSKYIDWPRVNQDLQVDDQAVA